MREIKFRGKVKYNGNHYHSNEWVYGYYFKEDFSEKCYIIDNQEDEFGNANFNKVEVIPNTVCQLLGFKDCVNKEIYENDIAYFWFDNKFIVGVVTIDKYAIYIVSDIKYYNIIEYMEFPCEELGVKGNIYDNHYYQTEDIV